jgi:hypothetical protein
MHAADAGGAGENNLDLLARLLELKTLFKVVVIEVESTGRDLRGREPSEETLQRMDGHHTHLRKGEGRDVLSKRPCHVDLAVSPDVNHDLWRTVGSVVLQVVVHMISPFVNSCLHVRELDGADQMTGAAPQHDGYRRPRTSDEHAPLLVAPAFIYRA